MTAPAPRTMRDRLLQEANDAHETAMRLRRNRLVPASVWEIALELERQLRAAAMVQPEDGRK